MPTVPLLLTLPTLQDHATTQTRWCTGPADWNFFSVGEQSYLFVTDGSRVYEVDAQAGGMLELLSNSPPADSQLVLRGLGISRTNAVGDDAPRAMPLRSLSLAVAQKCNLSCTYCYAQEGSFGGMPKAMSREVAIAAVARLFADVSPGDRVQLAFLGGEPLFGRAVLREATEFAKRLARNRGVTVGFSITTNGTMLTADDAEFFEGHGFAVTISLDGIGEAHDRLRSYKSGRGSFEQILRNVAPLLARQRRMQVSARVTVTPHNLELRHTLDELIALGFQSVGFSPMLASPSGRDQMSSADLNGMLDQMIDCGREFERRVIAGERYSFSNLATALREIHRGTHRPYPCGAGVGYFGVSAEGRLFACHRFVDDESGAMGDVANGVDPERQADWLRERHVHFQEPCRSCWARYLCGGGCHHEVLKRGRPACDYIRGWLHYCLQAYVRLLDVCPAYFGDASSS